MQPRGGLRKAAGVHHGGEHLPLVHRRA
jgi:hypothetical protein